MRAIALLLCVIALGGPTAKEADAQERVPPGSYPWFDAGVAEYDAWPPAVTSWYVPCVGTWQGTSDAELVDGEGVRAVQFYANANGRSFVFDEPKAPSVSPAIAITAVLPPRNVLPAVDPAAKGALAVCRSADGATTNYCALVADVDGATNRWVRFATPVPKDGEAVALTIAYREGQARRGAARPLYDADAMQLTEYREGAARPLYDAEAMQLTEYREGAARPLYDADAMQLTEYREGAARPLYDTEAMQLTEYREGAARPLYDADAMQLTGGEPLRGEPCEIQYKIDGEPLRMGDDEWLPIVLPGDSGEVVAVDFRGGGEVRSFSGTTTETPGAPVALTIPAHEGMNVVSVLVAGGVVAPELDGTYRVPSGSRVAVKFAVADGYVLSADTMSFRAETVDFTLPLEGRPQVLAAADCLRVNEILASAESGPDWVEIANTGEFPIDISGWLLSDKPAAKAKWSPIVGEAVVPAHGFLVVRLDAESAVHADLGLSADGETVAFATPGGSVVDEVEFGYQFKDVSYGRDATITNFVYFPTPTPGAANAATGRFAPTPKVKFSVPHGYYTEPVALELNCPKRPDAEIFYTTDGTSPTRASTRYTGPIAISRTTVVRAAVVDADSILQRDTSATYLFVDDIVRQSGTPSGFPANGAVNGQTMYYGMRSSILAADGERLTRGFTNNVRTVSLVIDPANLFNASTGIYVNARQEGRAWERAAMVEQIHPLDHDDEFSCACGVRIRGAASRSSSAPKHSLRLFFRREYGMGKLEHPIFGADGAAVCDKIDLRADQNQSYANGDPCETMVHEVFSRDALRDLGQVSPNTRYFHLFLNGTYWGLYMYEERVSQCYAAAVNGGEEEDYDVIRTQQPNYVTDLVEGERDAMEQFLRIVNQEGFAAPYANNYNRVRGLDANGHRDPALPVYLNVTNLVDFMLQVHSVADSDSPASASCFINQENNIMAFRWRGGDGVSATEAVATERDPPEEGFIYLRHDAEWSMGFTEYFKSATRGAQLDTTDLGRNFMTFCPSRFHWRLCDNAEYRILVADRFYRHCLREGGALTLAKNEARFRARMAEIDEAIVGEVARWGSVPSTHANRETWLNSCETYCLAFLRQRPGYHLQYYRTRGWYPTVDAPTLKDGEDEVVMDGAQFAAGTVLSLATPSSGVLYVTEDGSDPRLEGGMVNRAAQVCTDREWTVPVGATTLKARLRAANGEWSALEEVRVLGTDERSEALKASLRVREVMSSTREAGGDGAEFIVFTNLDQVAALDLEGVRITCAKVGKAPSLDITLGGPTSVSAATEAVAQPPSPSSGVPGERDPPEVAATEAVATERDPPGRGGVPPPPAVVAAGGLLTLHKVADWPTQKITNGKVEMTVYAPNGEIIQSLYLDADWWNGACDGTGAFFVAQDFGSSVTDQTQWRASYQAPVEASAAVAVASLASGDDRRREWLVALGVTDAGGAAIAGFTRDLRQLEVCYLLGIAPENSELELRISRFELEGDEALLEGALRVGGTNVACHLNGQLKLRRSESPAGEAVEEIELQNSLPFPEPISIPVQRQRQFFRLFVQ